MRRLNATSGKVLIKIDSRYFRAAGVEWLLCDPTKAVTELGWRLTVSFKELVSGMVQYDLKNNDLVANN